MCRPLTEIVSGKEDLDGIADQLCAKIAAGIRRIIGDMGARRVEVEPVAHQRVLGIDRFPAQELDQLVDQRGPALPRQEHQRGGPRAR